MNVGGESKPSIKRPDFVVQRRIDRPAQLADSLIGQPLPHRIEQPMGDLLIVKRFKETKETALLAVLLVVHVIDDPGDAAAHLPVAPGQPRAHVGHVVKRVGTKAHQFFQVSPQRRNPVLVATIQRPSQLQELFLVAA